jgi:hypothetical protein
MLSHTSNKLQVWSDLIEPFMVGTGKCETPSTHPSTGLIVGNIYWTTITASTVQLSYIILCQGTTNDCPLCFSDSFPSEVRQCPIPRAVILATQNIYIFNNERGPVFMYFGLASFQNMKLL